MLFSAPTPTTSPIEEEYIDNDVSSIDSKDVGVKTTGTNLDKDELDVSLTHGLSDFDQYDSDEKQ